MEIVPVQAVDEAAIKRLLTSSELPTSDLSGESLKHFLVTWRGDALTGVVGLEIEGEVALLRSLAVPESQRGRGIGCELVGAAENLAQQRGVREIFLLTTTAEEFFAARGYRRISREQAPPAIRAGAQFRELCPSSSSLMVKSIDGKAYRAVLVRQAQTDL